MAKYRKKPVTIEAVHWSAHFGDPETSSHVKALEAAWDLGLETAKWCGGEAVRDETPGQSLKTYYWHILIPTLEGTMQARFGDYIIRGVSQEYYPCKPAIFAETYEPVE
jgi:hypothetical protein